MTNCNSKLVCISSCNMILVTNRLFGSYLFDFSENNNRISIFFTWQSINKLFFLFHVLIYY